MGSDGGLEIEEIIRICERFFGMDGFGKRGEVPSLRERKEHLDVAKEYEEQGDHAKALKKYKDAVCIDFAITHKVIEIILKMEKEPPIGDEYRFSRISQHKYFPEGFTLSMLQNLCIIRGCDYLPKVIKELRRLNSEGNSIKFQEPYNGEDTYEAAFVKAKLTFQHQSVYDPSTGCIVALNDIPNDVAAAHDDLNFLGPLIPDNIAEGIATGKRHLITYVELE
ncbi:XPG/Rad2 endonuclease [Corchorus capsularis]|uniref:XPG/Rad2 endonuclease n=1 Tax=Corchorus capsularis TaxID=210143 RepID=A0A1R3G867_COCAP|nr:XPG/Rad2 endonuclease [Corchorus capsularis]